MSSVPREAAIGFDRGAGDYERGRPGYPPRAIAFLAEQLRIVPGRRVLDLAAGTGKLTRALVGLGADVVAVEPVAGMRAELVHAVPGAEVLAGTAEAIPLPGGTVDAVVVAQAFHWFDIPAAAAEIHRVLVAGGGLGIIRNEWDESAAWVADLRRVIAEHAGQPRRSHTRDWRAPLAATGLFAPLAQDDVANQVRVDLDTLAARVASMSYVAMLEDPARTRLLAAVRELAAGRAGVGPDGLIATPYRTHVFCFRATG